MNKAVEFVQAKVDEFGRRVFGREDIFEETARIKINKVVEVKFNSKNFEDNPADKAEQIKEHLARMKRSEDIKDLVLTIGSITLSVLTLLIPGGAVAGLLCARSGNNGTRWRRN